MKKQFKQSTRLTNNVIIYDLETGSADPFTTEPLEIGAIVVDINTFSPKENGVFGPTLVKPTDWGLVKDEALAKNGIKREDLEKAPEQKVIFEQFCNFCRTFQKKDSKWDALIPSGYNVKGFDNIIVNLLCKKYGYVDKDGSPKLFHPRDCIDLLDWTRFWFMGIDNGPNGYSLESVCNFFGVRNENAHTAMADTEAVMKILQRVMIFQRKLSIRYTDKFNGALSKDQK